MYLFGCVFFCFLKKSYSTFTFQTHAGAPATLIKLKKYNVLWRYWRWNTNTNF